MKHNPKWSSRCGHAKNHVACLCLSWEMWALGWISRCPHVHMSTPPADGCFYPWLSISMSILRLLEPSGTAPMASMAWALGSAGTLIIAQCAWRTGINASVGSHYLQYQLAVWASLLPMRASERVGQPASILFGWAGRQGTSCWHAADDCLETKQTSSTPYFASRHGHLGVFTAVHHRRTMWELFGPQRLFIHPPGSRANTVNANRMHVDV